MSAQPLYIATLQALDDYCTSLQSVEWLAVDTEFLREKTYYPQFCLLQIASEQNIACIDPLALESLDPLLDILENPNIVKVFHSGRQDLEIFYNLRGRVPGPLFDTQIAAPLLGFAEQIGYANLVSEMLGVNLSKTHTRTDWSRRPLTPEQLRYAADDVIYLGQLYAKMRPELEQQGRLQWLQRDFSALTEPSLYEASPVDVWQRLNGVHQLKGKSLSVMQSLAAWREVTAREQNLPRGWLLKDEVLFDLARQQPTELDQLKVMRGIDERTVKRHGTQLCELIATAINRAPENPALKARPAKKSAEDEALLDIMMAVVRLRAAEHAINPATLAARKDLEQLLIGDADARLMQGWRKNMVGEELQEMLNGELNITVKNGQLTIFSVS